MESVKKKKATKATLLIWLCWLVYMCSYLGKVNYSANIGEFESFYGVSHAEAGLVSTFFFFAYACGQVVNGLFCSKYNVKYTIFGAVIASSLCNLIVAISNNFQIIKFAWLINGAALSVLWPTLIGLLGKTIKKDYLVKASITMGTTVAVGTAIIYGLSSIFAIFNGFRLAFYFPAIFFPIIGIVWLCSYKKLTTPTEEDGSLDIVKEPVQTESKKHSAPFPKSYLPMLCVMALIAIVTNLVAEGLTSWVPVILKETFELPPFLSILLTLTLPIIAIFGNLFSNKMHKRIPNFIVMLAFFFACAGVMILAVIGLLQFKFAFVIVATIVLLALIRFFAGASNSTITSIFPLSMKGKGDSGFLAGILNAFCYVGSVIASYGLGLIADASGWNMVFYVLFGACVLVVVVSFVFALIEKIISKKRNVEKQEN